MRKISLISIITFLSSTFIYAQETTSTTAKEIVPVVKLSNDISVKFGGFVRAEYYIDSREIVGAVDDLFGFFPKTKNWMPTATI